MAPSTPPVPSVTRELPEVRAMHPAHPAQRTETPVVNGAQGATGLAEPPMAMPGNMGGTPSNAEGLSGQRVDLSSTSQAPPVRQESATGAEQRDTTVPVALTEGHKARTQAQAPMAALPKSALHPLAAAHDPAVPELLQASVSTETGVGAPARSTSQAEAPHRPEAGPRNTSAQLIRQVADAIVTSRTSGIELTLDPPELGRVRMSLSEGGGTMTVTIQAENAGTTDLMRRHQEQFRQDLLQQGYEDVRFSFQQGHGDTRRDTPPHPVVSASGSPGPEPQDATEPAMPQIHGTDGGVDIRI